jgi:PAS domain S-box-containing protein
MPPGQDSASSFPGADPERVFSQLFNLSPFPAVVSRLADSTVLAINVRTAELMGTTQEDAVGQRAADYYADPSERGPLIERIRRDGRADNVRLRITRQHRDPFWALVSAQLVTWQDELAILAIFHDITEQLAAEAALLASRRRLAAQSDALTFLTTRYTDPEDQVSERLRTILAAAAEALAVERLSLWRFDREHAAIECVCLHSRSQHRFESGAILNRDAAPAYFAAVENERVVSANDARSDPRTCEFGESYLIPLGIGAMLDVPLRQHNMPVGVLCAEHVGPAREWTVDEQNFAISVANLVVVALVEDERRQALTRLAESEARARLIVDTAHDAFIGIDSQGRIAAWNAQAEHTFGWTRADAMGRVLADTIIPPAFREAHTNGMRRFHETGEAPVLNQRLELTARHRNGREFPIELTITSPVPLEHGFFFGAFLRDISERRQRDDELRRAKEAAEAATRAKSEFLANMSHELRTPLNGVLGYAQVLQRDRALNAAQRDALEAIARCGSQLLDLINDVLDLSKIEAGRLDLDEGPTDLAKLIADLRYVLAESAEQRGLSLDMERAPDVPRSVVLDGRHVRQVLLNLLGNAIKFTRTGTVQLTITRTDDARLLFEVRDTGIGIEQDALATIFDAFTQTKAGAGAGGTGLGLAICAHLVKRLGDRLQVESEVGRGSRFYFALPLVEASRPPGSTRPDTEEVPLPLDARLAPGVDVTALVVDDSTASRRILATLLESAGVRVITAAGGLEAIELARTHRPEVIFMDLKMSDLDGIEATRRLGGDPATAEIPVVAVTASAFGTTRQTARDAGCVDYLSKPVRAESLFAMLQTHLGVHFVTGGDHAVPSKFHLTDVERRRGIAGRLRDAVALGDVSEVQAVAKDLAAGDVAGAAIGQQISRLLNDFDFDGLNELIATLDAGTSRGADA